MRKFLLILGTGVLALAFSGCTSSADTSEEPLDSSEYTNSDGRGSDGEFSFSNIKSCDEMEPFLNVWIDGLTPYDWNTVSSTEIHCGWDTSAGNVAPDEARSIEVNLVQQSELPDYSLLEKMKGYERLDDAWVAENGGVAFAMTIDIGISAAIGTTIWVPGVEVTVSGGRWANLPELDGPAGLEIAKNILVSR